MTHQNRIEKLKLKTLDKAARIYHSHLKKEHWIYLKSRGLYWDTVSKNLIGFCPAAGDKRVQENLTAQERKQMGIFTGAFDKRELFLGRITLPIIHQNQVVAMTSRAINNNPIKYLNQKGPIKYAYGMDSLKDNYVIVTEGPMDALSLIQLGYSAIGLLGANRLSEFVIQYLDNKKVYICFDKDPNKAGDKATISVINKLLGFGIRSFVISLPFQEEKVDVNSYLSNHKKEDFQQLLDNAILAEGKVGRKKKHTNSDIDIVKVTSHYLELKQIGGYLKASCPFHKETIPSFTLYPHSQSFFCFGCGATGDAIRFVQMIEGTSYQEAKKITQDIIGGTNAT